MEEVKIPITIDDSGFGAGTKRIIDRMENTQKEVNKTGMSVDYFAKHMQEVYRHFDKLTAAVNENTAAIGKDSQATRQLGRDFDETADKGVSGFGRLEKAAIGFFTIQKAKEFVGNVYDVRSEIEKLETSFRILVGDKAKADALFASIRKFATETPMQLKDLAGAAQTMMGFGIAAEDVMENLEALGNVSMGDSQKFQSLALAFSQMSATGKLMGQDLLQMINAGFNPLDQMAKTTGKSIAELKEEMSQGAISADMVRQAFIDATSEGGKFNGMLEAQSKTLAGAYSNLEGAVDDMLNEIGQKSEGAFATAIEGATDLVKNYDKAASIIQDLIVAYGSYKAALMVCNAVEKASVGIKQAMAVQEALLTAEAKKLAAARGISLASATAELGSVNLLTVAKIRLTAATKSLTAAMMANPYVLVSMAVAGLCFGIYKLATAEDAETAARRRANEEMKTFQDQLDEQKNKIQGYIQTLQDSNATEYQKAEAWEMLNKMASTLTEKYDRATLATMDLAEANKELTEQAERQNYDHLREELVKWQKEVTRLKAALDSPITNMYQREKGGGVSQSELDAAQAKLDEYARKLAEIDRIRAKMAEDNKPLEIRIKEANENVQTQQKIYDFYKRAADLAGELKTAHDEAAGVIANSGIPYNYEAIADETKDKYDALIGELEADVEDLRTRIAESPASLELEQELKGKEKALDDLISMKQQWAWSGATTIPLNFVMNFSQVETALQNAKNGQGINTQGMRFDGPTGTYVKDEATAPATMTASQWREDAYNAWKKAQGKVDAFWNKKEEMDKATFDQEYDRLKSIADQAKKDYDKLKGSTNGNSSAARNAAETARKHQAYLDLIDKQRVEQERAVTDMEFSTEQARINAMQDGSEKTLRQLKLDHEKRKEEIEREYADLKQAKIDAAKQLFEANPANKGKVFDASSVDTSYSEKEQANYKALMEANNATYRRALEDRQRMEAQAMLDYLKEYGSIQQQKYAIEREYNEKIAKEEDEWRKKQLEAEKKSRLSQMSAQNIAANIDWKETFKGVGNILEDIAKESLKKVEEYMKSAEFSALSAQDKQAYANLRSQLIDASGSSASNPFSKKTWDDIAAAAQRYRTAVKTLNDANEHAEEVRKRLTAAEEEAANNPADARLQQVVDALREQFSEVGETVKSAESDVTNAQSDLRVKTDAVSKGFQNFDTVLGQITSGTLSGFVLAVGNVIKQISGSKDEIATDFGAFFGEAGKQIGGLVGAILQIIDILGTEPAKFIDDLLAKVADVLEAVLSQLPEIIAAAIKGVGNIVGSVFTGLGGMVAGLFGGGADWSAYDAAMDKWGGLLDNWEDNLKYERELMEQKYGKDAIDVSEKALKVLQDTQKAATEIYRGWAGSGAGWFSHSNGYNVNEDTNWSYLWQYDPELAKKIDGDVSRLFDLTWQELEKLKNEAPQFWNSLHSEAQNYLDQYIEAGKKAEETIKALNKQLTTTTSDDVFSNFLDSLYELADGSEDVFENVAENWQKMVNRMVINNLIAKDFQSQLEGWYADLAKLQSDYNSGYISESAYRSRLDALKNRYNDYLSEAKGKVNQFTQWGIIKPIEEAAEEVTEEVGDMSDSIKAAFSDLLNDPTQDVEEWGKNLRNSLIRQMIETRLLGDDFQEWAKAWSEKYWNLLQGGWSTSDRGMTKSQYDAIKAGYEAEFDEMVDSITGQTKTFMDNMGYIFDEETIDSVFDNLHDQFRSTLMDMNADAEEWSKEITQTMVEQLIEKNLLNEAFDEKLDDWRKRFEETMSDDALSDAEREMRLAALRAELEALRESLSTEAQKYLDSLGYSEMVKEETPFKDLRSTFLSTLMDMEGDAEEFRKSLNETLTRDLIEKQILDVPITVNGMSFDDFNAYVEDWNKRYAEAVKNGNQEALDALLDELVQVRAMTLEVAEELRERLKEVEEVKPDTTFKDMTDDWISTLMDLEATAEDWAEDIGRTMARKIIEQMVAANMIQPLLDNLQDAFNEAMSAEGATWQSVLPQLAPYIDELKGAFGDLQPIVEQILNALGIFREEVEEEAKEGFSDLRGAFVSSLMDMEADAEKFGRDIARAMTEQMVSSIIEQQFGEQLVAINEAWFNALEAGDTEAMERIRQQLIELQKLCGAAVQPLLDDLKEIEYVEEVEVDETITSMRDSWLSALMDMKAGTQDFVNDIKKLLTQKLVEKFVLNSAFDSWLEGMQSQYDAIFNGSMSEEQASAAMNKLAVEWEAKAKEMQEQTQAIFDLTGWSSIVEQMSSPLGDLRSSFRSALMDMENDTEDFANDISKLLTEAFIDKFVLGDEFDKRLAEWQEQYAAIMKGNYSEEERASLLKQLQQAIAAAKEGYAEEAQAIQDLMGTGQSSDQTATLNMADKATYDQFETYLGIAVAQQMATLQGNDVREQILATLRGMTGITSPGGDTVKEIRSLLNTSNEYLLDIKRTNRAFLEQFGMKIDNIISKLTKLV